MGAKRITPEEIVEMHRLYAQYGTYAEVARRMGRSASAVSKYVQMKGVSRNVRLAVENLINRVEVK